VGRLAGEVLTRADAIEAVKSLPALVVTPSPEWLAASIVSGPGREVGCQLRATLLVKVAEPAAALEELENELGELLERLPTSWRFDRCDAPYGIRRGEFNALAADLFVSFTYSIRP